MKKILCLFLILGLVIAMTGCKKKGKKKDENIDKVIEYEEYVNNLVSFEIEEEPKGILEVDSNYESCLKKEKCNFFVKVKGKKEGTAVISMKRQERFTAGNIGYTDEKYTIRVDKNLNLKEIHKYVKKY